ncbi:MAG: acyl-CoA dehydrogenase family protein [Burkholderiales bacterium]|nr:acyl-CoA dehydrogenase family protein [Burkholderiales bacterium]
MSIATQRPFSSDAAAAAAVRERAQALIPDLRARAIEAEELRRVPDKNIEALRQAGLFRVLLPRRVGGLQADLQTFVDVVSTIGRGCGSTAWVLGVVNAHHWLVGLYASQAQDDVFKPNPDAIISAVIGPRGRATRVPGGYLLNGFWPFCSGSPAANWLMLGGEIVDAEGQTIDEGDFLLPIDAVEVKNDWDVAGLRGSGSNSVVAKELFVPEHRYLSLVQAIGRENPGRGNHEGRLYDAEVVPVLALGIVPAALGIAEGAMEVFKQRLPGKIVSYTMKEVQLQMPTTHMQVATAESRIDAARLLVNDVAQSIQQAAEDARPMSLRERARCRMHCAYAVRLCMEATQTLFLASGGSALATGNPIQRAMRDLQAINMHGLLCLETNTEMYGRVLLDLPQNTPLI